MYNMERSIKVNNLQVFKNTEFGEVRVIEQNGEPWFVAKDICAVLEHTNPTVAIQSLDDDERSKLFLGRQGEVNCINESGLYALIVRSNKPEAKRFRKWVTSEVLPSIRKHGTYMTPETLEEAILNPDTIIKIATALKEEQDKNRVLEATNSALAVEKQIMQPKADYFDELVDRNLLTNFRETAKQLGIKQRDFINFLLDKKYVYRDKRGKLMPYADKNKGLFEIKETFNEKTQWSGTQTLITPKGRETFRLLYMQAS